jgi:protein-tyrosine-phosphatase
VLLLCFPNACRARIGLNFHSQSEATSLIIAVTSAALVKKKWEEMQMFCAARQRDDEIYCWGTAARGDLIYAASS